MGWLCIRWPEYWSFTFSISPSNEYSGLISIRTDWFYLLAVRGTLKSLLQHHSSKASILWPSPCFMVQLSHPSMSTGKTMALTRQTFVDKIMSLLFNMLFRLVIGEGNGNPLQCSCLENPRDWGAWWAVVSGVAQSRTRLKRLSSSSSSSMYIILNLGIVNNSQKAQSKSISLNTVVQNVVLRVKKYQKTILDEHEIINQLSYVASYMLLLLLSCFSHIRLCATP